VVVYTLRAGNWGLESTVSIPDATRVAGVAVAPDGTWIAVCGSTSPENQAFVLMFKRRSAFAQASSDIPWLQMVRSSS
jgi:hypothetical protein